jgi:hypothetical protein
VLRAATITYRLDGFHPDPYSVFGRSVIDPSNGQRITSDQMDGGLFQMSRFGGTWGGLFPSGDIFFGFCIEPREFVNLGGTYTDEVVALEQGTTNIGGMGSAKADRLRELFGRWFPDFTAPLTRLQAGALQVAVWEIVREDSGTLDVYSGDIYFFPGTSEDPAGVVALGQTYVQSIDGTGPRLNNLLAMTQVGSQDIVVQALPEPASLALVGAGCLALFFWLRKKYLCKTVLRASSPKSNRTV